MELAELLRRGVIPGGYAVERELGRGGMGAVYLIRNEPQGRRRALKVILPKLATNERARNLFLREMTNCQLLDYPNVVRTYDSGYADGLLYLMMEFCDAGSLDSLLIAQGTRTLDEALAITHDVLAGLEYAHTVLVPNATTEEGGTGRSVGLVHRDLKPQNIFLAVEGGSRVAKVGDFGLAKAFDLAGLSGMTETGDAAGTPGFMPRQQAHNYKYVHPEVDVWAAAATLYTMLTGHTPRNFATGKDPWRLVLGTHPVPILDRGVALPTRLARIIDEALIDRPEIKFKSAAAFRAALEFGTMSTLSDQPGPTGVASWQPGGTVLNEFYFERVLGQGGFGTVALLRSLRSSERFAVKRARITDPAGRAQFLNELRNWINLPPHPHLVACRFFRTVGEEIAIFAEYVPGGSLHDWLRDGRLYEGGRASHGARPRHRHSGGLGFALRPPEGTRSSGRKAQ